MDTYLVVTRSKNPSDQRIAINIALLDLNLNPEILSEKSTNYGISFKMTWSRDIDQILFFSIFLLTMLYQCFLVSKQNVCVRRRVIGEIKSSQLFIM